MEKRKFEYMNVFEREKYYKIRYYLYIFFVWFFIITNLCFIYLLNEEVDFIESIKYEFDKSYKPQIEYQLSFNNINLGNQNLINNIISKELNQKYIEKIKEITFTSNQSLVNEKSSKCKISGCNGVETGGKIIIYIDDKKFLENDFKRTLCHELLHSIIKEGEPYHYYVYDISKRGICYK